MFIYCARHLSAGRMMHRGDEEVKDSVCRGLRLLFLFLSIDVSIASMLLK